MQRPPREKTDDPCRSIACPSFHARTLIPKTLHTSNALPKDLDHKHSNFIASMVCARAHAVLHKRESVVMGDGGCGGVGLKWRTVWMITECPLCPTMVG